MARCLPISRVKTKYSLICGGCMQILKLALVVFLALQFVTMDVAFAQSRGNNRGGSTPFGGGGNKSGLRGSTPAPQQQRQTGSSPASGGWSTSRPSGPSLSGSRQRDTGSSVGSTQPSRSFGSPTSSSQKSTWTPKPQTGGSNPYSRPSTPSRQSVANHISSNPGQKPTLTAGKVFWATIGALVVYDLVKSSYVVMRNDDGSLSCHGFGCSDWRREQVNSGFNHSIHILSDEEYEGRAYSDFATMPSNAQGFATMNGVRENGLEICSAIEPGQEVKIGERITVVGNDNQTCSVKRSESSMQLCEQLHLLSDSLGCSHSTEGFSLLQLIPKLQQADLDRIAEQLHVERQVAAPAQVYESSPTSYNSELTYRRYGCFTGETLVATVNGEKPISQIKAGDKIYSYSHETGKLVVNEVMAKLSYAPKISRALKVSSASAPIFVTEEHPFYPLMKSIASTSELASNPDAYKEIGSIANGTELLTVEWNGNNGSEYVLSRSQLQDYSQSETRREEVMTLSMTGEPRNFVVIVPGTKRGIVVHNKAMIVP